MREGFRLTPLIDSDLRTCFEWMQGFSELMVDDYTPKTAEELISRHAADLANGGKSVAILHGDKLVGAVWGEAIGDGMLVGHLVFERYGLSATVKVELAKAAFREIFAQGIRKLCWYFFADNRAFRVFLKRCGAVVEGNMKQATRRGGELVDVTAMASFAEATW